MTPYIAPRRERRALWEAPNWGAGTLFQAVSPCMEIAQPDGFPGLLDLQKSLAAAQVGEEANSRLLRQAYRFAASPHKEPANRVNVELDLAFSHEALFQEEAAESQLRGVGQGRGAIIWIQHNGANTYRKPILNCRSTRVRRWEE